MNALVFLIALYLPGAFAERVALTERVGEGSTRLLVLDKAESERELDRVVLRKTFTSIKELERVKAELLAKRAHARALTKSRLPVWPVTKFWSVEDERGYSNWVRANATEDFLVGSGIAVDCADHAIALRWIYAREQGLPVGHRLAGSKRLFGSWESAAEWENLPTAADWRDDERFKAALLYVLKTVYTHSLPDDLYPAAISPEWITPGTVYLTLTGTTGHARTILNIEPGTGITVIWGNEPARERTFVSDLVPLWTPASKGGFLRFLWPEQNAEGKWSLRAPSAMPGYSTEQFDWPESDYLLNISQRLGLWNSPEEIYVNLGASIVGSLALRFAVTARGYFICALVPCTTDDRLYGDWSTPSRDKRLRDELATFTRLTSGVNQSDRRVREFNDRSSGPAFPGAPYTALEVIRGRHIADFSADPTKDLLVRWAVRRIGAEGYLRALAAAAFENWKWREEQVNAAQALCFPQGATVPLCDPQSAAVMELSTARLDQAFRSFSNLFRASYAKASREVRSRLNYVLTIQRTQVALCSGNPDGFCTMRDYLVNTPERLDRMSSDPTASRSARFGF